jgi:hypothetical protein
MSRKPSDIDEVTQIYIDVGKHGWSDVIIATNGKHLSLQITEIFRCVPDIILDLCHAILQNVPLKVALPDEPGGAVVEVKPDPFQRHTMIFLIYEVASPEIMIDASAYGTVIFQTKFKRRRLIGMLMSELWKTHKSLSEPSYQIGRGNFPHDELKKANDEWDGSTIGPSFLK